MNRNKLKLLNFGYRYGTTGTLNSLVSVPRHGKSNFLLNFYLEHKLKYTQDMDVIKTIDLILNNPANNLTTTSKDLLETMKVYLSYNEIIDVETLLLRAEQFVKENQYNIDNNLNSDNSDNTYYTGIKTGMNRIINLIKRTTKNETHGNSSKTN